MGLAKGVFLDNKISIWIQKIQGFPSASVNKFRQDIRSLGPTIIWENPKKYGKIFCQIRNDTEMIKL
jgi:hypothetical protein